jgi:hypothetical protein
MCRLPFSSSCVASLITRGRYLAVSVLIFVTVVVSHRVEAAAIRTTTFIDTIPGTSAPTDLATITTDTGAFAQGHRDFARYDTPALCLAAVQNTQAAQEHSLAMQAAVITTRQREPAHDTLSTGAVAVARACLAGLPVRNIAERDLSRFFVLALSAGEDSLAHAIVVHQLATASDSMRPKILGTLLVNYMTARPARIAAAESLVTLVAAAGHAADRTQLWLQLQGELQKYWKMNLNDARLQQVAEDALAFVHRGQATQLSKKDVGIVVANAYSQLMWLAYLRHPTAPDSSWRILRQQAEHDLNGLMPSEQITALFRPDSTAVMNNSNPAFRVRPLHAAFWFPIGTDTVFPVPGAISLEYDIPDRCLTSIGAIIHATPCAEDLAQLQRWYEAYGSAGLRITVTAALHGHALFSGAELPAAEEARTIAWYVQEHWQLPVRVAVLAHPRLDTSDLGGTGEDNRLTVFDRNGRVIYQRRYFMGRSSWIPLIPSAIGPEITAVISHAIAAHSAAAVEPSSHNATR